MPFAYVGVGNSLWTFRPTASGGTSNGTTAAVSTTATPNYGDLLVTFLGEHCGTSALTSASVTDSSVGGSIWQPLAPFVSVNKIAQMGWWKIANLADVNNGLGITVTGTGFGGVGAITDACIECDVFETPPSNHVVGLDISQSGFATGSTTNAISDGPSNYPSFLDELAVCSAYGVTTGPPEGTNTYTGTSTTNLTSCLNNSFTPGTSGSVGAFTTRESSLRTSPVLRGGSSAPTDGTALIDQYGVRIQSAETIIVGGNAFSVRESAFRDGGVLRAGTGASPINVWTNTWTNSTNVCMMGATFVYFIPSTSLATLGVV